jgi:hypothetical protein
VILQPTKVATPLVAPLVVPPVQASVAPVPGWLLIDRVTEAVEDVTGLPELSSTVTTGWLPVPQTVPLPPPPGWVVNATWLAGPVLMVMVLELTVVKPLAAAESL